MNIVVTQITGELFADVENVGEIISDERARYQVFSASFNDCKLTARDDYVRIRNRATGSKIKLMSYEFGEVIIS